MRPTLRPEFAMELGAAADIVFSATRRSRLITMSPSTELLIARALEKPLNQRAAFLDGACQGDEQRRQRLEGLLRAHNPVAHAATTGAAVASADSTSLALDVSGVTPDDGRGRVVGRYKLLEKLGEGGCGVVYVAEQIESVRRRVALKIIKLGMDTKAVVARFEAERQALAMMDHPNIARVLDAGMVGEREKPQVGAQKTEEDASNPKSNLPNSESRNFNHAAGRPFFVMELVRGVRITEYCDQNQLGTRERLQLFIPVCHAIQHAHQKGIIHRDIKPSNILVTMLDGAPVPKVIDFGIAKAIEGRLTDATIYTQFHQFIGTPTYMSPEQAEMSGMDIDTRSDVFSLGVLLYELLTGQTPLDGKELVSLGVDAMRRTICDHQPARPSVRLSALDAGDLTTTAKRRSCEPPRLIHSLRGDLDWIVMKCLEKDRTRRYPTVNALCSDVLRHLNHEPVMARPPSPLYRMQRTIQRHRTAFLATAAVAITLVIGFAVSIGATLQAHQAKELASRRLAESEAISSFLTATFQSPDPTRDGRSVTVAERLESAASRLETDLADQPQRRAQLQAVLGRTYLAMGMAKEASPLLKTALTQQTTFLGKDHPDTLALAHALGVAWADERRYGEALPIFRDVLARQQRLRGVESREAIRAMMDLGTAEHYAGDAAVGLQLHQEALRLSRKTNGAEDADTARALHSLSTSYTDDEALPLREEALVLLRKVNGSNHPATLRAIYNLERSYSAVGRSDDALRLLEEAVPLSHRLYGSGHTISRRSLQNLERALYDAGRWQEALQLKADYARWDPKDLNTELLTVQAWFGRDAEYADSCGRLLKFAEGTTVPTTAERAAKACLLLPDVRPEYIAASLALAQRALALGKDSPHAGMFQLALGMAQYRTGQYAEAEKSLRAAQESASFNARFFRAMILFRRGDLAAARTLFAEAAAHMRPLPDDDRNPLAHGASADEMITWLAYREAKALLRIEDSAANPVTLWTEQLQNEVRADPTDSIRAMKLAIVHLWLGNADAHASICRDLLQSAANARQPELLDRAAKAYLLRPNPDPELLKSAAAAAERAFELASSDHRLGSWFRTSAGMAAFRQGRYAQAESLLSAAISSPLHENQRRLALAFRALSRARANQHSEALGDLRELEKGRIKTPDRARLSDQIRDQDQLAVYLAYTEAKEILAPRESNP